MTIRRLGLTVVSVLVTPASLMAQPPLSRANSAPDKNATQVMVTSFKSTESGKGLKEKTVGYMAADEMRDKMGGGFSSRQVYVIPVDRINVSLINSNFDIYEGLALHDSKQLATILRADEYISGSAARTPTGFRVEADLVLTRDIAARQPLGVGAAPKMGDAVNLLVKEMKEARKQLDGEKKCTNAAREKKYPDAIAFAEAGILAYPKATLVRMCLVSVLSFSGARPAEVAKVARDLVQLDPRSNFGLKYLADYFRSTNESDSLVVTLINMLRNEPRNAPLQIEAIREIVSAKNPALARPIIDSAITLNPGDPDLLRLRWQILNAVKDWPAMFAQGEELIRLDTAFADTLYFQRTALALESDSAWQKAAEMSARGIAKFPSNATMVGLEIQELRKAGQLTQALEKVQKAKASKVPVPDLATLELIILDQLDRGAELVIAAREMIVAGDTTPGVRQMIVNQGTKQFSAAQKLMATDAVKALADLEATLPLLQYADSIAMRGTQKSQVAFTNGAANLTIGNIKAQAANAGRVCQTARDARVNTNNAMISLPQAPGFQTPEVVQRLLAQAMQLDQGLGQMVTAFCR